MPSMWELVIILVIVALLFGTKKLKTIGGDVGGAIKGFRNAMKEDGSKESLEDDQVDEGSVIEGEVEKNSSSSNQA